MSTHINTSSSSTSFSNLKIIQHNCARSTNVMQSCLEYAKNNEIDLILIQEPWTKDQKTISHSNYSCIISQILNKRVRVCAFVSKTNRKLNCTYRVDIINDSDCQILQISIENLRNLKLINLYNEKDENLIYTNDRILPELKFESTDQIVLCEDFNAHHSWWNSRIQNSIRTKELIEWTKLHKCKLINISDEYTFIRNSRTVAKSVIDLTFASENIESLISNWYVDFESTGSDHEIIRFDIIINFDQMNQLNSIEMSNRFNVAKADWNKFNDHLKNQSNVTQRILQELLEKENVDNLNQSAEILTNLLQNAAELHIPKMRTCAKSKRWWNNDLTNLRKIMFKDRRAYKKYSTHGNMMKFKESRLKYFHEIRSAKQKYWSDFLQNAKNKKIFYAYKYIKPRVFEKMPSIQYEDRLNITFQEKCDAFIKAIYSKISIIDDENIDYIETNSKRMQWLSLNHTEIENAIKFVNLLKACESDGINWQIIQKAYAIISKLFHLLYSKLLDFEHHSICWCFSLGTIIKKSNKSDYTVSKAYRIIALLTCLEKIVEKIMTNRLSYWGQTSSLLHDDQIDDRKNRSAIDAVMQLTHDIKIAFNQKKVLTCILLNIKEAFDHVSKNQLLKMMKECNLSSQIIRWTKNFMKNRKISLVFDDNKEDFVDVDSEVPQKSSISSILWLIYIRKMHSHINVRINSKSMSFIDDVTISLTNSNAKQNCIELKTILQSLFDWVKTNNVAFDDSKSELIHFEKSRQKSTNVIILSNQIELKSQDSVKYLDIWLDKKPNFKTHVNVKIANATRALHSIMSLMKSEWGLSSSAARQLYMSCIISISDYESEIWYKNQKSFEKRFQKLQNLAIRKILETFKTTPCESMKIKASLLSSKIRLFQKNQKYAIRIAKIEKHSSISKIVPNTFTQNFEHIDQEEEKNQSNKFAKWNENSNTKKHQTQLIRILNSISDIIDSRSIIEKSIKSQKSWKSTYISDIIIETFKDLAEKRELELIESSYAINKTTHIFYTDESKCENNTSAVVYVSNHQLFHLIKLERAHRNCKIDENTKTISKNWKLKSKVTDQQTELFAIWKIIIWIKNIIQISSYQSKILVFVDSKSALQCILNKFKKEISNEIRKNVEHLEKLGFLIQFNWISSHKNILKNELADKHVKDAHSLKKIENISVSIDFLTKEMNKRSLNQWKNQWTNFTKKGSEYQIFNVTSDNKNIKFLSKIIDKLTFATIMQLKFGHEYLRDFQRKLFIWRKDDVIADEKCVHDCHAIQNSKHILLKCKNYANEIANLKKALKTSVNIQTILNTKHDQTETIKFLQIIKIATRKWLLRQLEDEKINDQNWRDIDR